MALPSYIPAGNPVSTPARMLVVDEHEQARHYFEKARAIGERSLGPDHPNVAGVSFSLGAQRPTSARGAFTP